MSDRKKILIIEHDDFLREILGNLLHKKGRYILNGFCIQDGIENTQGHKINTVILGTRCKDYKGKQSLDYIRKHIKVDNFFILNDGAKKVNFVTDNMQMKISELSITKILETL